MTNVTQLGLPLLEGTPVEAFGLVGKILYVDEEHRLYKCKLSTPNGSETVHWWFDFTGKLYDGPKPKIRRKK